jgi:1,2-diacylglycerol-3-alpha-glucose alpha-1,2-glucosyltransferase
MKKVMEKPLNIIFIEKFHIYKKYTHVKTVGGIETNTWDVINSLKNKGHNIWVPSKDKIKPQWVQTNKVDIVAGSTFDPLTAFQLWNMRKKYNAAVVQHAHTTVEDLEGGFLPNLKILTKLTRIYLKYLYSVSHLIITPSEFSKNSIKMLKLNKRPPIHAVSNGIKFEKFKEKKEYRKNFRKFLNKKYNVPLNVKIILNVGFTWKRKGPDEFFKCAKDLSDYWFVWVGPIKENIYVKKALALDNCIFTGYYDDICEPYYGADVLLFPSYVENQGIPLMEAAVCKLPIVARDIEPFNWLVHNKSCYKANNHKEFIHGIEKILSDSDYKNKLIDNAYYSTDNLHNFNKIGEKIEKLYKRAIKLKELFIERRK